jgi:uncharacterized protein (DUF488 family)
MRLMTIGFTKKSARDFFEALRGAGVRRLVDVRLNNVSQLAGFAKRQDLPYFLEQIAGIAYRHMPILAPTQAMLDRYKKQGGSWDSYAAEFAELMRSRHIEQPSVVEVRDGDCLLCSEDKPCHCHRRLVAEYLQSFTAGMEVVHLG